MRTDNTKPLSKIIVLMLLFLSITLGSFQAPLSAAKASAESQPATSELIADAGNSMSRAAGPEMKPVSEAQMPVSPGAESLKLLLLGSFLLLIATCIQLLSSRKNKPKSRPA